MIPQIIIIRDFQILNLSIYKTFKNKKKKRNPIELLVKKEKEKKKRKTTIELISYYFSGQRKREIE